MPPKGGIHAKPQANNQRLGMDTSLRWYDKANAPRGGEFNPEVD